MKNQFFPAPEVAQVGERLVEQYHPHLCEHQVRIEYIFCSETPNKGGKAIWGTARKVGGMTSFLRNEDQINWTPGLTDEELAAITDEDERDLAALERKMARDNAREQGNAPFFVITISKPVWDDLSEDNRRALVDHELMHCGARYDNDYKTQLYLIPHDFEGFNAEIQRHGLWRYEAARLAEVMKGVQLSFSLDRDEADE